MHLLGKTWTPTTNRCLHGESLKSLKLIWQINTLKKRQEEQASATCLRRRPSSTDQLNGNGIYKVVTVVSQHKHINDHSMALFQVRGHFFLQVPKIMECRIHLSLRSRRTRWNTGIRRWHFNLRNILTWHEKSSVPAKSAKPQMWLCKCLLQLKSPRAWLKCIYWN